MKRAVRATVAGARYLDLQKMARRTGRPTDELIQLYALECFLDRVTRSDFAQNFVLKGGKAMKLPGSPPTSSDSPGVRAPCM